MVDSASTRALMTREPRAVSGFSAASTDAASATVRTRSDHREVAAQQRHRGVLEVAVQVREGRRDVGDDAGAVVAEDGDGDDLLGHGRISWCRRLLTRRD